MRAHQTVQRVKSSQYRFRARAKPFTLHCSLLLLVLCYAFAGGMIFNRLEADALKEHQDKELMTKIDCIKKKLSLIEHLPHKDKRAINATAYRLSPCFTPEKDERSEWSFVTATLYGFGIVTTLGYNRIAPITQAGRIFCIAYGICGIPITMIIIANVGQYLNQFAGDSRRMLEEYRQRRRMSKASLSGEEYKESSIQVTSLVLLIVFLLYVALGALLLPALNGQVDFLNGLYYNFLCLTAIDFGQLVPSKVVFLPITFLYVCLGLAITTIAIDIGSEYMKKLHYLGKKMKDAAQTKIWFGGKAMKVKDLLHAVGKKCGIDPSAIDALDLENVVERTIAIAEGKEPPPDINEDEEEPPIEPEPRSEPMSPESPEQEEAPLLTNQTTPKKTPKTSICSQAPSLIEPDLIIRNPTFQSLSNDLYICSPVEETQPSFPESIRLEMPEDFDDDGELEEDNHNIQIMKPPDIMDEVELQHVTIEIPDEEPKRRRSRVRESFDEDRVPRKFREKKLVYATDAKKLYETYQEEWGRLERLSARLGPRRKSVLALASSPTRQDSYSGDEGPSTSRQPSPHRDSRDSGESSNVSRKS
ncbi:unnamed protein product, partial [Mesorhabditis belari]|uniref:Potassium channel domain-containing protein n=2 Tax=Mesorhabditis belari TaxID=2138241 RepID=A0AAF3J4V3_9BILA